MIIMGIDPGSKRCGYGILEVQKYKIVAAGCGVIKISEKLCFEDKLLYLSTELKKVISLYKPDFSAVESIFYGKNIAVAFTLGHFRGVIVYSLRETGIPVHSYTPREIKQSVTGRGNASKIQIEYTVQQMLRLQSPAKDDAADALACAICFFNKERFLLTQNVAQRI
jgi:crossover junction endodeoxyribonuclease RuvC